MIRFLLISAIICQSFIVAGQELFYTNPVGDGLEIADPYIMNNEGTYYLYGTSANDGFLCWKSKNLVKWEPIGYVFQRNDSSWGENSFWAPEVIHYHQKYYLIYSSSGKTKFGKGLRVCLAVSENPEGPFKDLHAPLVDDGYSCIDAHIFVDTNEKPYLFYEMVGAVGEFWKNEGFLWGVIMGVELSDDLSRPLSEPKLCLYPSQEWEGTTSMKARSNEGMTVFKHDSVYYMTYSGNHYTDPNYGVGYATSKNPLGMWTKSSGNPVLQKNIANKISGPGHNCIIKSPDGKEWFIVYHIHADSENPSGRRKLCIDRMIFKEDGSIEINGPTTLPQPLPSGGSY